MRTCTLCVFGITLVELLIVVSVLALLVGLGARIVLPRSTAASVARELAGALTVQRWHAVMRGEPVVLRSDDHHGPHIARRGSFGCERDAESPLHPLLASNSSALITWPVGALAFDADGRPRSCSGGGVGNTTIRITDRAGRQAAVVVAALGRVRWETR